jgi:hypothetical protein
LGTRTCTHVLNKGIKVTEREKKKIKKQNETKKP